MNTTSLICKTGARCVAIAAAGLSLLSAPAAATQWQDGESIRTTAEEIARERFATAAAAVTVAADALDPRLRMPACDKPLTGVLPAASQETARVAVEVRCAGARSWRLFVPVRVTLEKDIVLAAVPLERGKVLAPGDVILARREVASTPGGYLTTVEAAAGQVVRRSVPAGTALTPGMLDSPVLVKRGQSVTLEARSGPIVVQMAGVAKGNGALGEIIGVENVSSGRVVQGIVRNEKSVEIMVP